MTAIWGRHGDGWRPLAPGQFEAEQTLHELIADAPETLPLAGSPELVVLGSEVRLGNGSADLVAVESSGRLVVIEVKLSRNAEAKRAVVAQALAYAAFLRGMEPAELEQRISQRAVSFADATAAFESRGEFDEAVFAEGLESCLANGFFRLVFVLDGTSPELERIVDYLEAVTHEGLLIDLVTVSAYDIGSERVMVPQRVEPGRAAVVARPASGRCALNTYEQTSAPISSKCSAKTPRGISLEWSASLSGLTGLARRALPGSLAQRAASTPPAGCG